MYSESVLKPLTLQTLVELWWRTLVEPSCGNCWNPALANFCGTLEPCCNSGGTLIKPWWNPPGPLQNLMERWWNPGGSIVETYFRTAPGHPGRTVVEPWWNLGGNLVPPPRTTLFF